MIGLPPFIGSCKNIVLIWICASWFCPTNAFIGRPLVAASISVTGSSGIDSGLDGSILSKFGMLAADKRVLFSSSMLNIPGGAVWANCIAICVIISLCADEGMLGSLTGITSIRLSKSNLNIFSDNPGIS